MEKSIQFDPGLRELLLRKTGKTFDEIPTEEIGLERVPVIAKLADPSRAVDSLEVVARFGQIVTGRVPLNRIVEVRRNTNVVSLKASQTYGPDLSFSVPEIHASAEVIARTIPEGITGRGVIIAFCDWGCDFAHDNLRDKQGKTRLLYLWDQRGGAQKESPHPFGYGREFTRDQINSSLDQLDPYAALAYDPADVDNGTGTHSTHVMDIAAGNGTVPGSSPGVAPEADLIFVHLKGNDTRPQDTLGDSVRILEAIRFITGRAGDKPVVINLSLGKTGGPHDASPLVVQGIDALLEERPRCTVVMSTGNYFLSDIHSGGYLRTGEFRDLQWQVVPRNDEFAEMEIWYSGDDTFSVELIDPKGKALARVGVGDDHIVREGGRTIASIYHRRHDPNCGDNQIDMFLWPDAMIGMWLTRLHGEEIKKGSYHAWIERDDPQFQSRFTPGCAVPTGTIGSLTCGRRTITVGAYDARDPFRAIAPFSSAGPSRDGRLIPVISAPGVGIRAARSSQLRMGYRQMSGLTIKSGTSMAAPHVAGTIALMMQAAGEHRLTAEQIRDILSKTARGSPPYNGIDALRYGAGRIDAGAAVKAIKDIFPGPFKIGEAVSEGIAQEGEEKVPVATEGPKGIGIVAPPEETINDKVRSIAEIDSGLVKAEAGGSKNVGPDGVSKVLTVSIRNEEIENPSDRNTNNRRVDFSREKLACLLPLLLVELGDLELARTDENGMPIYHKQQPLFYGPGQRRYSLGPGRYNYHAANFVYNTAYRLGYDIPVHPQSSVSAQEGRSYTNTSDTFEAISSNAEGGGREYYRRFFEVVARPGQEQDFSLKEGDILLCGPEPGRPFGHLAIIVSPVMRQMTDPFFASRDSSMGKGVQCIEAGLAIKARKDRWGRCLVDPKGKMLASRMVLRFKETVIDMARILDQLKNDAVGQKMIEGLMKAGTAGKTMTAWQRRENELAERV